MITPVLPTYNRAPVSFVRGEGAHVFTEDGTAYLDFGAGVAVQGGFYSGKLIWTRIDLRPLGQGWNKQLSMTQKITPDFFLRILNRKLP